MRYTIKKYGDPILRTKCKDVTRNDQIEYTIKNMWETLDATSGVGIAAPQCGFAYNIFLLKLRSDDNEEIRLTVINPTIIEYSDVLMNSNEGCLSIPGVFEVIQRNKGVKVKFLNDVWEEQEMDLVDMAAIIFQHEFDHINGIMFIDYLSSIKKNLIKNKLKQINKNK